jgi:hypothetical protein
MAVPVTISRFYVIFCGVVHRNSADQQFGCRHSTLVNLLPVALPWLHDVQVLSAAIERNAPSRGHYQVPHGTGRRAVPFEP